MASMRPDIAVQGLRERKKLHTRQLLLDSGLRLFTERGYHSTTVSDISRHAGISERTFFRYFASKEQLVLAPVQQAGRTFLAEVRRRPAAEEPLRALREAGRLILLRLAPEEGSPLVTALRLVCSEPEVRAAYLSHTSVEQRELAEVLAQRESTAPDDLRPALLAGMFNATALLATLSWAASSPQGLQEAADRHFRAIHSAIAGHWHDSP
jgi:AcrR family transcriptional regulator